MDRLSVLTFLVQQRIRQDYISAVVIGAVTEFLKAPDETPFLMGIRIREARDIGAFWTVDWIVNDLIGIAIARGIRAMALDLGLRPSTDPKFVRILNITDQIQENAVAPLKKELLATFGPGEVNEELEKQLYKKWAKNVRAASKKK